ncbi:50S ribosomal protein L32e [Candidatus Woesearchaeota archaeon]|nr:50S ribosomal protein L32e [Candidatus Woesearchaeota archaeon]
MKKLKFIRQDAHKKVRLGKKWRRPRGLHSKMRLSKKGYNKSVSVGYGSPRKTRNMHSSGLKLIIIKSLKDLEKIDTKNECVAVAKTIGLRKKVEILKQAVKKGIKVVNIKDVNKFLKDVEEKIKKSKEEKENLKKKKEIKEKEKAAKKKTIEEKVEKTDEEKKEEKKKERDKLLTKKTE